MSCSLLRSCLSFAPELTRCLHMQIADLPVMIQGVFSDNVDAQLDATTKFRKSVACLLWLGKRE